MLREAALPSDSTVKRPSEQRWSSSVVRGEIHPIMATVVFTSVPRTSQPTVSSSTGTKSGNLPFCSWMETSFRFLTHKVCLASNLQICFLTFGMSQNSSVFMYRSSQSGRQISLTRHHREYHRSKQRLTDWLHFVYSCSDTYSSESAATS